MPEAKIIKVSFGRPSGKKIDTDVDSSVKNSGYDHDAEIISFNQKKKSLDRRNIFQHLLVTGACLLPKQEGVVLKFRITNHYQWFEDNINTEVRKTFCTLRRVLVGGNKYVLADRHMKTGSRKVVVKLDSSAQSLSVYLPIDTYITPMVNELYLDQPLVKVYFS